MKDEITISFPEPTALKIPWKRLLNTLKKIRGNRNLIMLTHTVKLSVSVVGSKNREVNLFAKIAKTAIVTPKKVKPWVTPIFIPDFNLSIFYLFE